MSEADLGRDLGLARSAVLEAGIGILRAFGAPQDVSYKGPDQPVTPADLAADATLRRLLQQGRPDYGWLSEETADRPDRLSRERVWIVDPIDGTSSYIAGRKEYAVSVGLSEGGRVVLGVVLNPSTGELFRAVSGGGAWVERIAATERGLLDAIRGEVAEAQALRVTTNGDAARLVLLASRSEVAAGELDPFDDWSLRPSGSTAYKLGCVAAGRADAFFSRGPKSEWDVCGGAAIVHEAGGRVTDLRGAELEYNRTDPSVYGIVATNGLLHETLLRRLASLPPPPRLTGRADAAARTQGKEE